MRIAALLSELKEKDFYVKFIQENPSSFFAAGFFVLDDSGQDKYQLDFYIPEKKRIAVSEFPFSEMKVYEDKIESASRLKVVKVDICDLRILVDKIKKENNNAEFKVNKIIALLKDDLWQLTCLSNGFDILKIYIDSVSSEVKKYEKVSLFNIAGKK